MSDVEVVEAPEAQKPLPRAIRNARMNAVGTWVPPPDHPPYQRKNNIEFTERDQKRIYSPVTREILFRMLDGQTKDEVVGQMGCPAGVFDRVVRQRVLQEVFRRYAKKLDRSALPIVERRPKTQSEILQKLQDLSGEALETLAFWMRNAIAPSLRVQCAQEILNRAGYVKIEKQVRLVASAEDVIKELNRQRACGEEPSVGLLEAVVVAEEPEGPPEVEVIAQTQVAPLVDDAAEDAVVMDEQTN